MVLWGYCLLRLSQDLLQLPRLYLWSAISRVVACLEDYIFGCPLETYRAFDHCVFGCWLGIPTALPGDPIREPADISDELAPLRGADDKYTQSF